MRHLLIALGLLAAAPFFGAPAQAQNYHVVWISLGGGGEGGGGAVNCGFTSFGTMHGNCARERWLLPGQHSIYPAARPTPPCRAQAKILITP